MRPPWWAKALLQQAFSVTPGGSHLNYLLQRHLTRGYPVSDAALAADEELGRHHVRVLERHGTVPIANARFFEFGAGWDLAMPLVLRSLGVTDQLVVDVRRLVRPGLVADVARRLHLDDHPDAGDPGTVDAFLKRNGINYRAPCDARATGEPSSSVDYVTSTNTLEHIPAQEISAILRECHRVLRPGGVMSFQVDYKDHYSYFDRDRSPYAFLGVGPRAWRLFNPSLHFQNRLRHEEYLTLYDAAGFAVVECDVVEGSQDDVRQIASMPPHPSFRKWTPEQLAVRESRVVLTKRAAR